MAYQNSPSAVVPSALAASHRSAATRQASRHRPQPVSGDQASAGPPVDPVGSMHHTRPNRARVAPCVAEQVALHAGGHHGPAPPEDGRHRQARRLAALGRAHHDDGLRRLGRDAGAARRTGEGAEEEASGRGEVGLHHQRAQVASRGPARTPARAATPGQRRPRPAAREIPASSAPPSASGTTTEARPATC